VTTTMETGRPAAGRGRRSRAVVIGSGFGGLAIAIRLLADGHDVTIVERRPTLGGRASRMREAGYTWDTGPSLITMPWLFDELFRIGGSSLAAEVRLHELDPMYRIGWTGDRRHFDFTRDVDGLRRGVAAFDPHDAANLDRFIAATREIHERGILRYGRVPFTRALDFVKLLPEMVRLDAIRPLSSFVGRYFDEPHVRQVFDFHSLFIGGDPARVPAIYAALVYLQIAEAGRSSPGTASPRSCGRVDASGRCGRTRAWRSRRTSSCSTATSPTAGPWCPGPRTACRGVCGRCAPP
jgi:phytoene desaturase